MAAAGAFSSVQCSLFSRSRRKAAVYAGESSAYFWHNKDLFFFFLSPIVACSCAEPVAGGNSHEAEGELLLEGCSAV